MLSDGKRSLQSLLEGHSGRNWPGFEFARSAVRASGLLNPARVMRLSEGKKASESLLHRPLVSRYLT